jgi:tetratricopeptide (TPR) repeat protein
MERRLMRTIKAATIAAGLVIGAAGGAFADGGGTRKNGDAARAIPIYEKALGIDPKHKGAHEYIGEAYLVLGDLTKAKEHLRVLDKLCFFPCEEYADLKKAVQAYEASGGRSKPTSRVRQ